MTSRHGSSDSPGDLPPTPLEVLMRGVKSGFAAGGILGLYLALMGGGDLVGLTLLGGVFGMIAGTVIGEA